MKKLVVICFICISASVMAQQKPQFKNFKIEVSNIIELENFDWESVKDVFAGLQETDSIAIGFKYHTDIQDKNKDSKNFTEINIKTLAANVDKTIKNLKKLSQVFIELEREQKKIKN